METPPRQEVSFSNPNTHNINARLLHPLYQRFIGGEPRFFPPELKARGLVRQDFICPICYGGIDMHHSECHHMVSFGPFNGSTSLDNLVVVHAGRCHSIADERAKKGDLVVGGTIYDAEPSQFRGGHVAPIKQR